MASNRRKTKEMNFDFDEIRREIEASSEKSSVYIGADSKCFKKGGVNLCAYAITIVLHKDSSAGGKIFKDIKIERDYGNIRLRLMNEVYKVVAAATEILDSVGERNMEVHLDISTKKECGSNVAAREASGYVLGTLGLEPKLKPFAFAASCVADRDAVKTATRSKDG